MKCQHCGWKYPSNLLHVFNSTVDKHNGKLVCGICALAITNEVHGMTRTKFDGKMAEVDRLAVIRYRFNHPDCSPVKE